MAFDFESSNQQHKHNQPYSIGWDLHNFGSLNADMSTMVMEATTPFFSQLNSDFSTGYLQDALVEWTNRCKRRRLFPDENCHQSKEAVENCWDWGCSSDPCENSNGLPGQTDNYHTFGDEPLNSSLSSFSDREVIFPEIKAHEDAASGSEVRNSSSYSLSDTVQAKYSDELGNQNARSSSEGNSILRKKLIKNKVVYPFAVVKPGGFEGDITLNDINERMLMPPTRPVRHPVGDFACRPCVSPNGTGISGKAVVAFTKIQTQGRGTITIIRTSG